MLEPSEGFYGDGFGTTIEDGRLVVLLFFAPAPDAVGAVTVPML